MNPAIYTDSIIPSTKSATYHLIETFIERIETVSVIEGSWITPSLLQLGIFIGIVVLLLVAYNSKIGFRLLNNNKLLLTIASLTFISGVVLYFIGFDYRGNHDSIARYIYPFIASTEMFLATNHYVRLADVCKDSPGFMTIYSITFLIAVSCSLTMLYRLIGFRLGAWYRRTLEIVKSRLSKNRSHYHLFFHPNEESILLAKDIYRHCAKKERTKIVFICTPENTPNSGKGLAKILGLNRNMKEKLDKLHTMQINPLLYFSKKDITEFDYDMQTDARYTDVLKDIGIGTMKRILRKANKISIYSLSEDDTDNIRTTQSIFNDTTIRTCSRRSFENENKGTKRERVNIYFTSKRSNYTELFKDILQKNETEIGIHLIDTAYLSIESLRHDWRNLPVNFVDIEEGQVTSPFNSLIIGFNQTGQEAFKFIYEFGAFIGNDGEKSSFHCCAIDKNMNNIAGGFYRDIPGLKDGNEIELMHCDINSTFFWDIVSSQILTLNYIVIALGNDLLGISLAVDIYKLACRIRYNDLDRFKIFVRSYQKGTAAQLNLMANHFNIANKTESRGGEIIIFGEKDALFTYETIIQNKLYENAIEAYEVYRSVAPQEDNDKEWHERRKYILGNNPNIFQLQKLKRKEGQDLSTSRHIETKLILLGIGAEKAYSEEEQIKQEKVMKQLLDGLEGLKRENGEMTSKQLTEEEMTLIIHMAMNEHIRWNAGHTLLGYLPNPNGKGCNEIAKTHACITSWEGLRAYDTDYQLYDYKFIQTAIKQRYQEWYGNQNI